MKRKKSNKINLFTKDLEKFIDEQKTQKERNSDLRSKIIKLGAHVKKKQMDFKEIKNIKEEKKKEKIKIREYKERTGG
ncbi:hypothetical protein NBO_3g0049 [Nosema bombycis CQ1]|uniref:Uncharacterized protein n=1 Tax=Nosema bombycis (strain CQ1 / CVCC 102059) TaxID=578461 RepID=R0MRH5_NOSB1|nr:hypothetical protein NBO_3g0049 [Nosema bombycis CQ1]|eukprot:EOB15498.1 hypothetical protein NBO_3g0049 [Nosema bombycis CQ1]